MKGNIFRRWLCIIIAISMIVSGSLVPVGNITTAYASENDFENGDDIEFAGGTGTKDNPYLVETVEQLSNIKHHLKDAFYYKLVNDLDFNNIYNAEEGQTKESYEDVYGDQWVAIGTDPTYFSFQGHFDGGGHTISNMKITSGTSTGVFGYCNGTITNLKVKDSQITTTGSAAGMLVGELLAGGEIDRCAAVGGSVAAAKYVGGLVGVAYNGAKISNVYVDDVEIGLDYMFMANKVEDPLLGGINSPVDGPTSLSITNWLDVANSSLGMVDNVLGAVVTVLGWAVDGLDGSSINKFVGLFKSILNGDFTKTARTAAAGGIVGFLSGDLTNAWVYTTAGAADQSGAYFANRAQWWANLNSDLGLAEGWLAPYAGPVVGRNFYGSVTNAFETDKEHTGLNDKAVGAGFFKTSAWFQDDNNIPRIYPIDSVPDKYNGTELTASNAVPKAAVLPSDADGDGLYEIYTPYDLAALEYKCWWSCELMNDLYLKDCGDPTHEKCTLNRNKSVGTVYIDDKACPLYEKNCVDWGYWVPLCRDRDQYYEGDFYGNGHTIYGLEVATNDAGGLFGYVLGDIMDLNVSVDKIDAYGPAGGLAAGVFYPGNIYRCSVVGPHGLAGDNGEDAWDINGGANMDGAGVGGLAGYIGKDVEVKDCYTIVNVSNSNWFKYYELDVAGFWWNIIFPMIGGGASIAEGVIDIPKDYKKKNERLDYITGNGVNTLLAKIDDNINNWDKAIKTEQDNVEKAKGAYDKANKEYQDAYDEYGEAANKLEKAELAYSKDPSESAKKQLDDAQKELDLKTGEMQSKKEVYIKKNQEFSNAKAQAEKNIKKYKEEQTTLTNKKTEAQNKINKTAADKDSLKTASIAATVAKAVDAIANTLKGIGEGAFKYGTIIYENRVGGFVGDCRGKITNCYSGGKVLSSESGNIDSFVGAFVGRTRNGDSLFSHDGKIMSVSEMINNCYYSEAAGHDGAGTMLTADAMTDKDSYVGFDFNRVWSCVGGTNNSMPYLDYIKYDTANETAHKFAGGDGSESDPFIIDNMDRFMMLSDLWYMDYHYKLTTDLKMELGYAQNNQKETVEVLKDVNTGTIYYDKGRFFYEDLDEHNGFQGHLDGNGHKISFSLGSDYRTAGGWLGTTYKAGYSYGNFGLFPRIGGSIKNLEIVGTGEKITSEYDGSIAEVYNKNAGMLCSVLTEGGIIENIKISNCTVNAIVAAGSLAAYVEEGAIVRNILIDNVRVIRDTYSYVEANNEGHYYECDIAGLVVGQNKGTVEDVVIYDSYIGFDWDDQAAIHNNLGTAKRIYINNKKGGLSGNKSVYHLAEENSGTHHYYQGQYFDKDSYDVKTTFAGLDFANTWTMAVNGDNVPTSIALRCMKSTFTGYIQENYKNSGLTGKGTKEEPFIVATVSDLNKIGTLLDKCHNDLAGIYFKQTANIDCSEGNIELKTIGTYDNRFGGIYDGNGYTITLKDKSLFGFVDGATIKNLVITVKETIESASDEDIENEGLEVLDNANCGILTCMASNSLIFNCSIERNTEKDKEDLASQSTMLSAGGFAATATDCNIINCKSEAVLAVTSQAAGRSGVIAGEIINTDEYNGTIVGLNDSIKPAVINCAADCRYNKHGGLSTSSDLCIKTIGKADDDALVDIVGISVPDNQTSLYITLFKKTNENIQVDTLNNTENLPDELVEEAYVWKYNEATNALTLRPSFCDVTIRGTTNVSIENIYKVTVQESRDTWEEVPLYDHRNVFLPDLRNGTKLVVEVSNNAAEPDLRWEMRDARTNANITSAITENRYVQQEDKDGDEQYRENELLDSSVVEFVVDQDMTVHAYDESDVEFTGLHVSTDGNTIQVSEYEQLTLSALKGKGVQISKAYNYGYSEEVDAADTNLQITPAKFDTAADEETVTVTYTHEGKEYTKQFKVEVIPRVMTDLIVTVPDEGITGITDIQEYQSINGVSLNDAGVKFYKRYNFGPDVQIEGDELSKITAEPDKFREHGVSKNVTVTYKDGYVEKSTNINIRIMPKVMTGILVSKQQNVASIDFQAYEPITAAKLKNKISVKKVYAYAPMEEMTDAEKAALTITVNDGGTNYLTTVGPQNISIAYQTYNAVTLSVNITPRVLKGLNAKTTGTVAFAEYQPITAADLSAKGVSFEKVYEYGSPVTIAATQSGLSYTLIGVPDGQQYFTGTGTRQIKAIYTENDITKEKTFTISLTPRVMNGIDAVTNSGSAPVEFQAYEPITVDKLISKGVVINQTYPYGPGTVLPFYERQYLSVTPSQFTAEGENQKITITYSNNDQTFTDTLNVNITKPVTGITAAKKADIQSISFQANEEITIQKLFERGMEVKTTYDYAPAETLPSGERQYLSVSPSQFTTTGNQSVTITYSKDDQTFTDTLNVNITSKVLDELIVQTAGTPSFSEYQTITAASLSTKGVVFKKKYEYGDPVNVTATDSNLSIKLKNVPEGQQYFTGTGNKQVDVAYTENGVVKTTSITVGITAKVVSGISITKNPDKLTYNKGENINLSGGRLCVSYQNTDHTDVIDMTASGVTVEGYNKDVPGTYNVYIRYNGVRSETSFQVTVKDDTYTIKPAQAGFTLISQPGTKQSASGVLWVKNNLEQSNGGNSRRAYVKFALDGLEEYMAENNLEIESAELSYSANIDRTGTDTRTIYVKKVKETGWTNANLTWGTAPVFEGDIATATVSGTQYQKKTADITAYLNSRISSGQSTATLGFEVSKCGGEVIGISNTTSNKPTLIVKFKEQVNISIDESSPSNKPVTSCTIGDNLDLTKGRIKVTYADGRAPEYVALNNAAVTVSGYNENKLGDQTLTVKYMGAETSYKVTVIDVVSSIAFIANSQPKINYIQGQTLDRSQGTIRVTYASGRIVNVPFNDSKVTVSGYNKDQVKAQTIKVVYEGKETSYTVTVNKPANQIADLNITFNTAIVGQNLSISSAKVVKYTGTLANTQTSNITDTANIQITGFNKDKGGNQTITVSYGEYSEQMTVYVYTKKTETIKIGVNKANHSKKGGSSIAGLTSDGYVKNYYNNTMQTYIKMNLSALQVIENRSGVEDFTIKSAKLKFQAKGFGTSGNSRYLQVYKVNIIPDSTLHNGGNSLPWENNRLKTAIGSHWAVNKNNVRTANWDVTAYVKETYEDSASVLFGYGLTQSDNNKEVRILDVYDASKTYLEVTVEYLQ